MTYKFSYKRRFFYKTVTVAGHMYEAPQDKMVLFFPDGGIQEIANWRTCSIKLGADWVLTRKKDMEQQAGTPIVVK